MYDFQDLKKSNTYNYFLEPMLFTSLLLVPISFIYFKKKYYILSILILLNAIFSYIYHLDQCCHNYDTEKDSENNKKITKDQLYLYLDMIISITAFIFSLRLALKLDLKTQRKLLLIVIIAFSFYYLNLRFESYNYHLFWHISVLLGQLLLSTSV